MRSTLIFIFALFPFAVLVYSWGLGFLASGDLINVSGNVAQRRLAGFWPKGLNASLVSDCSIRTRLTAESQETLIAMTCSQDTADTWKTHLRSAFAVKLEELDEDSHGIVEVRTSRNAAHPVIEAVATWWRPSGDEFLSYQAMAWYKTLDAPVSRSYAYQYDAGQKRLWISLIVQSKNPLWNRGEGNLINQSEFRKAK